MPQLLQVPERFLVPQSKQVQTPRTVPQQGHALPDAAELQERQNQNLSVVSASSSAKEKRNGRQNSRARNKQKSLLRRMSNFLSEKIREKNRAADKPQQNIIKQDRTDDKKKRRPAPEPAD